MKIFEVRENNIFKVYRESNFRSLEKVDVTCGRNVLSKKK